MSSEEVTKRSGLKQIQRKMGKRKLQWFGYVRIERERSPKDCRRNGNALKG